MQTKVTITILDKPILWDYESFVSIIFLLKIKKVNNKFFKVTAINNLLKGIYKNIN